MHTKDTLAVLAMLGIMAFLIWVFIIHVGCGPTLEVADAIQQTALEGKGCEPEATRCLGQHLQICQADHTWALNVDCAQYEPSRACCDGPKGFQCYRPYDCEEQK